MSKEAGLENRYQVIKRSNPYKEIDCIVLEFDDPIARAGIVSWAYAMQNSGYTQVFEDTMRKLEQYEKPAVEVAKSLRCRGTGSAEGGFCMGCRDCDWVAAQAARNNVEG